MTLSRRKQIEQRGSPSYPLYIGILAAGETEYYDLETENVPEIKGASNYLPLDFAHVVNNDVVDIEVIINGTRKFYYPAGLAQSISNENIYQVAIKNLDPATATTANKISLVLKRRPVDVDNVARILKRWF